MLCLSVIFIAIFASANSFGTRPHPVHYVEIEDAPYSAAVLEFGEYLLDGTILTKRYVATLCYTLVLDEFELAATSIVVGTKWHDRGGIIYNVSRYLVHPHCVDDGSGDFNFALMMVANDLEFSETVQPIGALASTDLPAKTMLWTTGFGTCHSHHLLGLHVPIIDHEECQQMGLEFDVHPRMICTENYAEGSCWDNYGSPLVFNNTLYGIALHFEGCEIPGIFSRVSAAYDWFNMIINK